MAPWPLPTQPPRESTLRACTTEGISALIQLARKPREISVMAKVQNLFRAPKKRLPMEEVSEVRAVGNIGFEGCAHGRSGRPRQVLLVDRQTLQATDVQPGIIRGTMTTSTTNLNT